MATESAQDVLEIAYDFVEGYFNMLLNSPAEAHKFYGKDCKFNHSEEDGSMSTTTTLKCISSKILSLNYGQFRVEIKSVNAQESVNSGILILVTGILIENGNIIRSFTQALHLVRSKKRLYVFNDMLQYVDDASSCYERNVKPTDKIEGKRKKSKFVKLQKVVKSSFGDLQKKFKAVLTKKSSASTSRLPESKFPDTNWITPDPCSITSASTSRLPESKFPDTNWITPDPCNGRSLKKGRPIDPPDEQVLAIGRQWRGNASKEFKLVNSFKQNQESTACTSEERQDAFQKILAHEKSAQEANRNASKILFTARSNVFNNSITIDLHDQHVKEAMWIFKRHLKYCTLLRSVQFLIVITGYGSHTDGVSKIKPSVIDLLNDENVEWKEVKSNKGALEITIDKDKEFSFLKSNWASS